MSQTKRVFVLFVSAALIPSAAFAARKQGRSKRKPAPAVTAPAEPEPAAEPVSAAPAPEPTPAPEAQPPPKPPEAPPPPANKPDAPDVAALRRRYDELRDAVFRSRARREALEQALFSTKLTATLRWEANRHFVLKRAELRLDGTRVWEAGDQPVGDDPVKLAPRSVAPGPHVLSLRVEVRSRDDAKAGYTSEQSFAVDLKEGKETKATLTVDEDDSPPNYNPEIALELD